VTPPEKVIRKDGSKVEQPKGKTFRGEASKMLALLRRKQMFLLVPVLVGFGWNGIYLGIYQTK
jgi:hypothetical protein